MKNHVDLTLNVVFYCANSGCAAKRPWYALKSKGSYVEIVQPPSMANRKTCQPKGFSTGELAPEATEEVQLSSGARFKGVNLAPKEKVRSETGDEM